MVMAIVIKELREIRLFAALALAIYGVYVSKLTGHWNHLLTNLFGWLPGLGNPLPDVPFVQDGFTMMYGFVGFALAIALGFRQSFWELRQGTFPFLLHRPLSRRAIMLTKLVSGAGVLLLCTVLPIAVYAAWAATPGTHPGPFEWSMTGPDGPHLALHAAGLSGRVRERHPPRPLVRLPALSPGFGGDPHPAIAVRAPLAVDRAAATFAGDGSDGQQYSPGSRDERFLLNRLSRLWDTAFRGEAMRQCSSAGASHSRNREMPFSPTLLTAAVLHQRLKRLEQRGRACAASVGPPGP